MPAKKVKPEETPTPAPYVPKYIRTRTIVVNERKLAAAVCAVLEAVDRSTGVFVRPGPGVLQPLMHAAMKALLETRGR